MHPAEETQWQVPAQVGCDRRNALVAGQSAGERRVQRRARVEVLRLAAEDVGLALGGGQTDVGSEAFACSASLPNAAGSLTARSASTLRSSSTPASFSPEMNWL